MSLINLASLYYYDNSILNGLALPDQIDKDVLISNLLIQSEPFEVLYPNPEAIKTIVPIICKKWKLSFDKWAELTTLEYNPIHNFDRNEEYTDDVESSSKSDNTADSFVTAYDSDALHQESQNTDGNKAEAKGKTTHKGHLYGNIGVTRTQEMLMDEVQLRKDFNVYDLITDALMQELCIMVY